MNLAMPQVEMQQITFPAESEIKVELTLTSKINFTAVASQRRVSKLMLDRVGLFYGERPSLIIGNRLLWRVPIWLSLPTTGPLGQVGTLDVDVQTGEIIYTSKILDEIRERGHVLVERTTSQTK
jgi:hypothetical protein